MTSNFFLFYLCLRGDYLSYLSDFDDLLIIDTQHLEKLLNYDNPVEHISVYILYYYMQHWENLNQLEFIKIICNKFGWKESKTQKIINNLLSFGLIDYIKPKEFEDIPF